MDSQEIKDLKQLLGKSKVNPYQSYKADRDQFKKRKCIDCERELDIAFFNKNKRTCQTCRSKQNLARYHASKYLKKNRDLRTCLTCSIEFASHGPHNRICVPCKRKQSLPTFSRPFDYVREYKRESRSTSYLLNQKEENTPNDR